ncbi:MAG: tetratricopeptide repeat protein [Planctomycetaceae bacterium]
MRSSPRCRTCGLLAGTVVLLLATSAASADDVTSTYFEQLRLRRLFSVAEGYCIDRLAAPGVSDELRARLTVELSRTLAEHAKYTGVEESAELYDRALKGLDSFLAVSPPNPLRPLLETERALIPAGRGEFLRWQAGLFPHNEKLRKQTIATLDDASTRLMTVEQVLAERTRADVARANRTPGELAPHEIRALLNSVRFALGVTQIERAKLFPRGTGEQVASLVEADEWLRRVASGPAGDELTAPSQLRLAESQRLRGDFRQALSMLSAIEKASPPTNLLEQVVAQRALTMLDHGKLDDALSTITQHESAHDGSSGELLYVKLQTLKALWKNATEKEPKDAPLAAEILDQIQAQVKRADRDVGGYWAVRCRTLAAGVQEAADFGGALAEAARKARGSLVSGNAAQAIEEFGAAAAIATREGRADQAQEFAFTRASILLDEGRLADAASAFQEAANQHPNGAKAAEAHLLWAWCAGRMFDKSRSPTDGEQYARALIAHRETYAKHATAVEAAFLLAEYKERQGAYAEALKLYEEVPLNHPHGLDAKASSARCYEQILADLDRQKLPRDAVEKEAINRLDQFASNFPDEPARLGVQQAEVALRLARIRMNRESPDYARADRLLERTLASPPDFATETDPEILRTRETWKAIVSTAARLRIVSLAGQNRLSEAHEFIRKLSTASPGEVLSVLDGLAAASSRVEPVARRGLADLQLKASEEIAHRRGELAPLELQRLQRSLAEAYMATGQPTKAIGAYELLLKSDPRNPQTVRIVANLLVECGTDACIEKALGYWRQIEAQQKKGTREWLEASYYIAWCCFKLEQMEECRKILRVTRVLYPELGGEELKRKFDQLEKELRSSFSK